MSKLEENSLKDEPVQTIAAHSNKGAIPKSTSFAYGQPYQLEQVEKHRNRRTNHWQSRLELLHQLVNEYVQDSGCEDSPANISTIDVGCSVGTIAIEMAQRGFDSYGVDFDPEALKIAAELAQEDNVSIELIECDVANLGENSPTKYDIALCFDIFEHLHDDEIGSLLQTIKSSLKEDGVVIFYSFPLQYDYLFFGRWFFHLPLALVCWLPVKAFARAVKAYEALVDIFLILLTGNDHKERIEKYSHCNPLTLKRLRRILERAGYEVVKLDSAHIYPFKPFVQKLYRKHPISHRSVFGIAKPAKSF